MRARRNHNPALHIVASSAQCCMLLLEPHLPNWPSLAPRLSSKVFSSTMAGMLLPNDALRCAKLSPSGSAALKEAVGGDSPEGAGRPKKVRVVLELEQDGRPNVSELSCSRE